jgi:hypothetical protein
MQIFQIISPDGYIADLHDRDEGTGILGARFHFPLVSDYIRSAFREGKPYFFTGRSGNAQIGIKTDLADGAEPVVDASDIYVEGRLQNLNPLLGNALDLFKKGDEIGRLAVMDPELRIRDVRHYLHKRLFVGKGPAKAIMKGLRSGRRSTRTPDRPVIISPWNWSRINTVLNPMPSRRPESTR